MGIGVFVSGIFLLSIATALYANDIASIYSIVLLAFIGAFLGDHVGYFVGRYAEHRIWNIQAIEKFRGRIEKVLTMLERSTPLTVCAGRMTPAIRSFTPLVAGLSGVSPLKFSLCDLLACSIWATGLYLLVNGISAFA